MKSVRCFCFLLVLAITCLAFVLRKSYPFLLTGWLWFLGMLVPMIGLVQVGLQAHADRYTYLPQIGLCIAVTWGAWELSGKWRLGRTVAATSALLLVATLGVCAYRETLRTGKTAKPPLESCDRRHLRELGCSE